MKYMQCIYVCLMSVLSLFPVQAQTLSILGRERLASPHPLPAALATMADNCDFCVELKKPNNPNEVIIDARDGTVYGNTRFKTKDRVKVIITNKNPFLYEYAITAKAQPVSETVLGAFFNLLGGPIPDVFKALVPMPASGSGTQPTGVAAPPPISCPDPRTPGQQDTARINELAFLITALKGDNQIALNLSESIFLTLNGGIVNGQNVEGLKSIHQKIKTQFDTYKSRLVNPGASCRTLCETADSLEKVLAGGVTNEQLDAVQAEIEKLQRLAQALKDRVVYLHTKYADCTLNQDNQQFLRQTPLFADGLLDAAGKNSKAVQAIRDDLTAFGKLKAAALKVKDRSLLQETLEFGPFDSTTEVIIELKRKLAGSGDELKSYAKIILKFGEAPFFTISGGVVFSTLARQELGKIQGFELDRNGTRIGNTLTTVIGVKEQSDTRISPLVLLNGRLWAPKSGRWEFDGIHLSFGVTAKNDGTNTNIEYLVGPSFSFLERQLFLTVGGYAGRVQQLAGDLYLGQPVPAATEVTIQKNYRWRFGAAITYKIK
jgi:hypothetical protein